MLRFKLNNNQGRRRFITIINVYGPTLPISKDKPATRETFYLDLQTTLDKVKGDTVIISGDFNSKVGIKQDEAEHCLGSYSKGKRNENGDELVNFCITNNAFISNSAFKHKSAHITTWAGQWTNKTSGCTVPIYNQIDYILVPNWLRQNLIDSRTYSGIITNTDHRLLITTMTLNYQETKTCKTRNRPP